MTTELPQQPPQTPQPAPRDALEASAQQPKGFVGFMTTVPGVLTALAGVVTALGSVWIGLGSHDVTPTPPTPSTTTMTITQAPQTDAAPPEVSSAEADALRLGNANGLQMEDNGSGLVDACAQGDYSACAQLLTTLVQECDAGYGISCDILYAVSPVGTALEEYGATCGYRFDVDVAGTCEDQ